MPLTNKDFYRKGCILLMVQKDGSPINDDPKYMFTYGFSHDKSTNVTTVSLTSGDGSVISEMDGVKWCGDTFDEAITKMVTFLNKGGNKSRSFKKPSFDEVLACYNRMCDL